MKNQQVIIIGGGLAGLTAATFLARAGVAVTLCEKAQHTGGRAITETKKEFQFNLGPHALYAAGHGTRVLRELGIAFSGDKPSASGAFAIYHGKKHTMPNGAVSLMATSLLGFAAKMEAAKLLNNIGQFDAQAAMHLTVNEWVQQNIRNSEVQLLVKALFNVSTYACDAQRHSAGAALSQLQMALTSGVYYLDHGWQTLVNGLRDAAEKAGVKILTHAKAEKIEGEKNAQHVRFADDTTMDAAAIILATNPQEATALLALPDNNPLIKWAHEAIPVKAACLDVALESLPQPRTLFALGMDSPLYFSVHSATAKLTPTNGGALIHVAKYLDTNEKTSAKSLRQELETLLDLVQPGWRTAVIAERFIPTMTVTNALVTAAQGAYHGRPAPSVPDLDGVYVAGDWVGAQGMLADASFASAQRAAELVQKHLDFQ